MVKRLSVSNFRCLDNFTLDFPREGLILGFNGAGKSTVFDLLRRLQGLLSGQRALTDVVTPADLTEWTTLEDVNFILETEVLGYQFAYKLAVRIPRTSPYGTGRSAGSARIGHEELTVDGVVLLSRTEQDVHLHEKSLGIPWPVQQPVLPALGGMPPFDMFRESVSRWVVVRPNPIFMEHVAAEPSSQLNKFATNVVAWYTHFSRNTKWSVVLSEFLLEIWSDFDHISLDESGPKSTGLILHFKRSKLNFHQLSDGERMLILLYMVAALLAVSNDSSVFIDEPDNFIAVSEVQPWLLTALDNLKSDGQLVLASHHPEIADTMGESRSVYLYRESHSSGTKAQVLKDAGTMLPFSERLTKGWFGG